MVEYAVVTTHPEYGNRETRYSVKAEAEKAFAKQRDSMKFHQVVLVKWVYSCMVMIDQWFISY